MFKTVQKIINESIEIATNYGQNEWLAGKKPQIEFNSISTSRRLYIFTENDNTVSVTVFNNNAIIHEATMTKDLAISILPTYIGNEMK